MSTAAAAPPVAQRLDGSAATASSSSSSYVPRSRPDRSKMGMGGLGLTSGALTDAPAPASTSQRGGGGHSGAAAAAPRERRRSGGASRQPPPLDDWGNDGGIPIHVTTTQGGEFLDARAPMAALADQGWGSSMLAAGSPPVRGNTRGGWNNGPSAYELDGRPGTRSGEGRPSTRSGTSSGTRGQPLPLAHVPALPNNAPAAASGARRVPGPLGAPAPSAAGGSGGAASSRSSKASAAAGSAASGSGMPPREGSKAHGGSKLAPLASSSAAPTATRKGAAASAPAPPPPPGALHAKSKLLDDNADPNNSSSTMDDINAFLGDMDGELKGSTRRSSVTGATSGQRGTAAAASPATSNQPVKATKVAPKLGSLSSAPTPALMAVAATRTAATVPTAKPAAKGSPVTAEAVLAAAVGKGRGSGAADHEPGAPPPPAVDTAAADDVGVCDAPASPSRAQRAAARAVEYLIDLAVRSSELERVVRDAEHKAAEEERAEDKVELTDEAWESMVRAQKTARAPGDDFGGLMRDIAPKLPAGRKGGAASQSLSEAPFNPEEADFKYLAAGPKPAAASASHVSPVRAGGSTRPGPSAAVAAVAVGGMNRYNRLT